MSMIKDFEKLCFKKLKAAELFNEYLSIRDKDKWLTYINPNIEKITNGEYVAKLVLASGLAYNPIVTYSNTQDIALFMVIIKNLFPNVFIDNEYMFKNNELYIRIDSNTGDRLVDSLLGFGLVNINELIIFLILYIKKFMSDLENKVNPTTMLSLYADKVENPLSLLRCMTIFDIATTSYNLSIDKDEFIKHTKASDLYADEMAMFTLFEKFTENCDMKPLVEVTTPSAIYFLAYSDYELYINHVPMNSTMTHYNYCISVKDNKSLDKTIKEIREADAFISTFKF
jgi:hypothetical protein